MFEPDQLQELGARLRAQDPPLAITFHPESDTPLSEAMEQGAEALSRGAGAGVQLRRGDGAGLPAVPALSIEWPGRGAIHYLALPEEREAQPFAEIVTGEEIEQDRFPGSLSEDLAALSDRAELLVFIAASCPFCPEAVRAARAVAFAAPAVTATVVDSQRYEALAEQYGVLSAPTTLLDGEVVRSGVIPAPELAELILGRGGAGQEERVFTSRIDGGELDLAADSIVEGPGAAPFLALWKRSATSSRIGLMVLAEKVLERAPQAFASIVPGLVEVLESDDDALRGDTADLLGQTGDPAAHPALKKLLADPNPEVSEIAAEALGLEE